MKQILIKITFMLSACIFSLQGQSIDRVEPMHWWAGMENPELQLLVYGENVSDLTTVIQNEKIEILKIHKAKSPNYLFIDLDLSKASAGVFNIQFKKGNKVVISHEYNLKNRKKDASLVQGFDSSDAVLLITPDRFVNGNASNDQIEGLLEQEVNRSDNYKRHGGDIEGIIDHLSYIDDLGYTAIWTNPLLTNDMSSQSYHGYAITDLYEIDPRFGTLDDYKALSKEMSSRGMKLIMDQVANHCGLEHWWMKDLPFEDWVNFQKEFENGEKTKYSNHRRTTNQDRYASESDKKGMADGWFVSSMPDLNQRNPFMAKYIIQNSIWWVEEASLGGIRQDTYPYPDKQFMSDWAGAIMNEYPNFSIVGEEWSYNPLLIGYWQDGKKNQDDYDSNLTSSMDFAMQKLVIDGLKEEESWDKGLVKIYEGLANDFGYSNPEQIMVFPDNHDMSRIHTQMDLDVTKTKMALSYYALIPRVFQGFYGTEILMHDSAKPGDHGLVRTDFPGGWTGDKVNAFTGAGLTDPQRDMQNFMSKLLNYRKSSTAIHKGKTVHFAPFMGTYFMFRTLDDETVVVILNKNEEPMTIDLKRYVEIGLEGKSIKSIIDDSEFVWGDSIDLEEKGVLILTTKK
ncbi:glycoside hydrolase family 13 protein [Urechidicola vernalis]|uniref:Glycoside hydrolase family 13 protein n=1 Tax=Urechidicola vernalis TaxID=3075600 RepID=A0ABU2Y468_9FLAO|nr:glycoside hydrolase family 13 protein [Urechidicola sp. P050]MDT0552611.1 glycoside hydrolase family 13 protein [Urechidicola sp. P050]